MDVINISKRNDFRYFRKEPLLDIDEYTKPAHREELNSLAQIIQNLIVIEKGTYPNDPDFGVGIGNYIFELMDNETISEISGEIEAQITKYIFYGEISIDVDVRPIKLPIGNTSTLKISIDIHSSDIDRTRNYFQSDGEDEDEVVRLDFALTGNSENKKVVSKLIN